MRKNRSTPKYHIGLFQIWRTSEDCQNFVFIFANTYKYAKKSSRITSNSADIELTAKIKLIFWRTFEDCQNIVSNLQTLRSTRKFRLKLDLIWGTFKSPPKFQIFFCVLSKNSKILYQICEHLEVRENFVSNYDYYFGEHQESTYRQNLGSQK